MNDIIFTHADTARILLESLPYIRRFSGEVVVIKYGGHAMIDEALKNSFALNVALLRYVGVRPIIVHGGGPQIGSMLQKLDIKSAFYAGLRITDEPTMEVVEMVLVGKLNKEIVGRLNMAGARAVGLCGRDGCLVRARKLELTGSGKDSAPGVDLGRVGEVTSVDTELLNLMSQADYVPVIAPTGMDEVGGAFNINADDVAAAVAAAMRAKRLLLLTDVPGLLDKNGLLIRSLPARGVQPLLDDGTISGGMIPKVKSCLTALDGGVEKAMIIDGRTENCLLLELFTDAGIGSEIVA
ncbi:MAG: acetylglutamate kinase [Desulfovibrio sp.]|nr:acetylglutamate kinase [Desulfovibrio sp.]